MNYYELAQEELKAIETLRGAGMYRHAVFQCCMAIEYFLKTKLVQVAPTSELLEGHDIVNILRAVQERFPSSKDLVSVVRFCRKYFNEARYPSSGTAAYTKEFAEQFAQYVDDVKHYIDHECMATAEDLAEKFKKY